MKISIPQIALTLILLIALAGSAEARTRGGDIAGAFFVISLPIIAISFLIYHIVKRRYIKEIYLAAIEKGISVPPMPTEPKSDARKPALVLIALGLGFSIATFVTASYAKHGPEPVQISIWGLIPILIGAALWFYKGLIDKEQS